MQALQFSLLAGRIFFKGVRYHGQNETILLNEGYFTWRYWFRHVQELDCQTSEPKTARPLDDDSGDVQGERENAAGDEAGGDGRSRLLPCRLLVNSRGVEWFIYNRTPAYDAILRSMRDEATASPDTNATTRETRDTTDLFDKEEVYPSVEKGENGGLGRKIDDGDSSTNSTTSFAQQTTGDAGRLPSLLNLLPIGIECSKGAIVMGNRNTRSILTAKFNIATGQIDARRCRSIDHYKQIINVDFQHPVIEFKHNRDHVESQVEEGAKAYSTSSQGPKRKASWLMRFDYRKRTRDVWTSIRGLVPYHKGSVESLTHPRPRSAGGTNMTDDNAGIYGQNRWLGLTRYLDEDDDFVEQERWKAIEYGEYATIVDSPAIAMRFYWDEPGTVPSSADSLRRCPAGFEMDINGDAPPDWGIDLKVRGGTINYGPWADRQRADLQAVFFPPIYKDAIPAAKLVPGQNRVSTVLKVVLEIEEVTTLRVPTREDSKDWKWKGRKVGSAAKAAKQKKAKVRSRSNKTKKVSGPLEERPFGWIDIKVAPDSALSFTMDLVARASGYKNNINLDLRGLEISSSVNHGLLWRSQSQVISCDLSNPLGWNKLRQWQVYIQDHGLELFILRDHMFLLTDLINDWSSGPLGDFHTFVPFEYSISLRFADFKLFLNANDSNIINNPSDLDDNTFVLVWGQELRADLAISTKTFRPSRGRVKFDVKAYEGGFKLRTPPRNTQHTYLTNPDVASLRDLRIDGSYNYFTRTSPSLTDVLLLNVHGLSPRVDLYGFLIRYFMKIKDNYFGDDIHFRTLEEYQDQVNQAAEQGPGDPAFGQHSRLSNDLDVILGITAERSCAFLPAHLYSSDENIRLEILTVVADLRITNYYMDLAVSSSPIAISHTPHSEVHDRDQDPYSNTQVFIDGLEVFGHRLFGLPPVEPTYICNWDFDVGSVTGECSIDFLRCFAMALGCFSLSFEDAENALPPLNPPIIHDVTFLRARTRPILVGLRVDHAALILSTGDVRLHYNDWGGPLFSDRMHVFVPALTVALVDDRGTSIDRSIPQDSGSTYAYMQLTLVFDRVKRKRDFKAERQLQQEHVALHDSRTRRTPWLILDPEHVRDVGASSRPTKSRPPAMPYPYMPEPLVTPSIPVADGISLKSSTFTPTSLGPACSRRSSFLTNGVSKRGKSKQHDDTTVTYQSRQSPAEPLQMGPQSTEHQRVGDIQSRKKHANLSTSKVSNGDTSAEYVARRNSSACTSLAFSSPYKRPYFPLLATKPVTSDVPALPDVLYPDSIVSDAQYLESLKPQVLDQDTEQSSLMMNLSQGVRALCTPEALSLVTQLLAGFQTNDAVALLDNLQVDSTRDVLKAKEKRVKGRQITDVRCFVPWAFLRFVNSSENRSRSVSSQERYDVTLDHLTATATTSDQLSENDSSPGSPQFSFHLILNQVTCAASESVEGRPDERAVISLSITDPVLWISHGPESAAGLQFNEFQVTSASRKVDYISFLVRQTIGISEDLAKRFSSIQKARKSRLRLLVLLLTIEGKDVPDPPFLTRASYVLRSASHHLRSSDSWKAMSRLRYMYRCLPAQTRDKIDSQCNNKLASCPRDAGSRVIASFENWRTWDLAQVRESLLMQRVYAQLLGSPGQDPRPSIHLKASVKARKMQFLVDPGPNQNEISIENFAVGAALNQASSMLSNSSSTSISSLESSLRMTSTIQVHCAQIAIRLHWALLDLLENVVQTVKATTGPSQWNKDRFIQASPSESCLHIAVSSDTSILTFDTRNINMISLCQGLKTSFIFKPDDAGSESSLISFIFDADAATSEIKRHAKALTLYRLRRPRVIGSRIIRNGSTGTKPWKFVGSGQDVNFQTLVDPLQLIEIADSVLQHEVAHVKKWAKSMQIATISAQSSTDTQSQEDLLKADVALFLDCYSLSLTVLPSLTYQICGTGARTSIRSGLRSDHDLNVDFDLKAHSHIFRTDTKDASNELSTFQIPPINGRLSVDLAPRIKSVVFNTLVERIVVDAPAIHAIFTAINRPEIISLGTSIDQGVSAIRDQYARTFDVKESDEKSLSPEPILYNAYATLAGLAVHASTSDSISVAQGAQLQFKMGRVHLKATNRDPDREAPLEFSEIEAQLHSIKLDLLRFENLDLRPCGNVVVGAVMRSTSKPNHLGQVLRAYQIRSDSLQINIFTETASVVVAVLAHLQDTLKTVDLSQEVKKLRKLRHPRLRSEAPAPEIIDDDVSGKTAKTAALFSAMYSLELTNVCVTWRIETSIPISPGREPEDLILSFTKIDLATRKDNAARLLIENLQLQMVPASKISTVRSLNSALLPEVVFNVAYVSTAQDRRLAFQAAGKSLDLRLTSQFILPANDIRRSIALAIQQVRTATADWNATSTVTDGPKKNLLGNKKVASLLIDADFAGAVVYIQGRNLVDPRSSALSFLQGGRPPQHGRYNQFTSENENNGSTTLKAPGLAFKVEYRNAGADERSLNAEIKVDASSNILYPTVVPLVIEVSSSVKDIVGEPEEQKQPATSNIPQPKFLGDERLRGADPSAIFGNCRLNLGLCICKQEFSLSCQPIARVAATARFDDIYVTVNTVQTNEHGRFFTISGAFTKLQASVQHVYSRESTGSFEVDSVVVSLMNSKHVSTANGISAILNISPMKAQINGKQAQDFLLFREIWIPPEIRHSPSAPTPVPASESQAFIGQRYQQIAAAGAFPWNATISIAELDVQVDLGQSLGKSAFVISGFWVSSKKTSDWEQNLCLGFHKMAVNGSGRMSGFVEMQDMKVRTSIQWPLREKAHNQTPLVQASLAFKHLRIIAAFDYQAFLIADITSFAFMMYNVRDHQNVGRDRLVGVLDGDKVQVFCTPTSASQAIALYQAFQRLHQEKVAAYETLLRDIERFLRRKSSVNPVAMRAAAKKQEETSADVTTSPLKLQTDVVVTLKAVNLGAFPSTFFDNQIFKMEALDTSARFAVVLDHDKIHSTLGMTLGQLRIALAAVTRASIRKTLGEVSVADVVAAAIGSRGGTILKVPKLVATMETWQTPDSTQIDYVFKSSFQGKVDVGWNYSRISYIRGMWTSHARALAQRLGKPLPQSAVQITGGPRPEGEEGSQGSGEREQEKITAVVNVPQSKYQYTALQPAIIETPQLRDMGEATPPLEWIGLHRDRLPILTHQIVIVTLLEVAKEVDDAYSRILGSS